MEILRKETLYADKQTGEILAEKIIFKRPDGSVGVKTINNAPTKTQKHYKNDVNMTNIIKKYQQSHIAPPLSKPGKYLDFREFPRTFSQALEALDAVQDTFDALPSEVRSKFRNNPQELLDFVSDPQNKEEGIKLGLIPKPIPPPRDLAKDIATEISKIQKPDKA